MFEIFPIRAFSDNYIWMLVKDDEVTVVDPGDSAPVIDVLNEKNLNLNNIIITHHHFDHTGGIQKLNEVYDCDVYGPSQGHIQGCLLYTSPSPRDATLSRMPSSA